MSRQTCTDHCAGCGEHFHGLRAFELHRRDQVCANPAAVVLASGAREGEPALQIWTRDGSCDKGPDCWRDGKRIRWVEPVIVWQVATTEAQREALQDLQGRKSGALAG